MKRSLENFSEISRFKEMAQNESGGETIISNKRYGERTIREQRKTANEKRKEENEG